MDVAAIRSDLCGLTVRLQAVEQITSSHTPRLTTLEKSAQEVEHTQETQERRIAALKNACRKKNLKMKSKQLSCLTSYEDSSQNYSRLCKPRRYRWKASSGSQNQLEHPQQQHATRNTVVQFESGRDKAAVITAARERSPLNFESMQLTFCNDLSSGTLAWKQFLCPLTTILRTHKIRY
ncbi:Hypothetical predicted protein [Pelobates cultripes]|uniref:Uncharacterized protein n=1 Tax=Pelobates cultripes TaxID=61616 RepID=A0AAD1RFF8_PELCU|nr:Hypothetical predicted protein [Pelobates cultripes]